MAFLPNEIWIHEGDSISWTFATDEIHTLTFLTAMQVRPPFPVGCPGFSSTPATFDGSTCVTTPPSATGATFTVDFPQTGNFRFVCLVHENMTGVVHVLALSKALPHGPEFYRDAADDLARELLSDVDADNDHDHRLPGREEHDGHHHVAVGRGEISSTPGGSKLCPLCASWTTSL